MYYQRIDTDSTHLPTQSDQDMHSVHPANCTVNFVRGSTKSQRNRT